MCLRLLALILFFSSANRLVWSLKQWMPECVFGYEQLERPFIHAISKSPNNFYDVFNERERYVSPLTVKIAKGNFTALHEDLTFVKVPKTGTYALYLQINIDYIVEDERSLYNFQIGKISRVEPSHVVKESVVANAYLPSTFVGLALCVNLIALSKDDLLNIKLDSNIVLRFSQREVAIQLIAYMVSPKI